ncbi:MAG: hypothetical protein EXS37_19470 [Opitutus sp.]|nr:hypothetical protein [Opitutus sp.]
MKTPIRLLLLSIFALAVWPLFAAGLEPSLGKKGKLLLDENFESGSLPSGWTKNTGMLFVADGALHASEVAANKHVGAFRKALPLQNCAVQLDFKFGGATTFHVGFDPAPGELKKQGHLFSLMITPDAWNLTEHGDKSDPKSKNVPHAKAATKFAQGQWYTLLLEMKGDALVAHIDGKEALRATAKDFHVKKPGLVFRVGGKDGQEVVLDNVKVWALE